MKNRVRLSYLMVLVAWLVGNPLAGRAEVDGRPNIVFLFSDDHALNAISAYGGPLAGIAPTPNIDRLATEGAIFKNSFVANSICAPSRACVLTGKHSHKNGLLTNGTSFNGNQWTIANALQDAGYSTAVIGKWHLVSDPVGFDYWEVLPNQGNYYNPDYKQMDGSTTRVEGYVPDISTDKSIAWLEGRDTNQPFFLMCQYKAPHRTFSPASRYLGAFDGVEFPEPDNLFDDYSTRSATLPLNEMEIDRHFYWAYDMKLRKEEHPGVSLPGPDSLGTPEYDRMNAAQREAWDAHFGPLNQAFLADYTAGLTPEEIVQWKYQRYMRNYLSTVKAVDENVGRMLDYLDANGLAENTIVVYSSDQGFYLGEHGWYDKRWMFEESFKMPFLIRWPGTVTPGLQPTELIQNIDYAPTFCEAAGIPIPPEVQGASLVPVLTGTSTNWRNSVYYAYYGASAHHVPEHYGVRTDRYKLIYFPNTDEWNMFDLDVDPSEMNNIYDDPANAVIAQALAAEYVRLREDYEAPGGGTPPSDLTLLAEDALLDDSGANYVMTAWNYAGFVNLTAYGSSTFGDSNGMIHVDAINMGVTGGIEEKMDKTVDTSADGTQQENLYFSFDHDVLLSEGLINNADTLETSHYEIAGGSSFDFTGAAAQNLGTTLVAAGTPIRFTVGPGHTISWKGITIELQAPGPLPAIITLRVDDYQAGFTTVTTPALDPSAGPAEIDDKWGFSSTIGQALLGGDNEETFQLENQVWVAQPGNGETVPNLTTTVSGLDGSRQYNVYGYIVTWDSGTWETKIGLDGRPLVQYGKDDGEVMEVAATTKLNRILLGSITNQTTCTVDWSPRNNVSLARSYIKGIGVEVLAESQPHPPIMITGISMDTLSGDMILTWTSELGSRYSILSKSNLTNIVWTTEASITGDTPLTTYTHSPLEGVNAMFYKVQAAD